MSKFEDLLSNPDFIKWVHDPSPILDRYWTLWMKLNPDRREDMLMAREILKRVNFIPYKADKSTKMDLLNRLLEEGDGQEQISTPNESKDKNPNFRSRWFTMAAILLGILCFTYIFQFYTVDKVPAPVYQTWTSKSTNHGEKLNFRLPDGTIVWLNSGSSLTYPTSFDSTIRFVKLHGEGFFEVAENKEKPFIVNTGEVNTMALGTSFNIANWEDSPLRISLFTGKVGITNRATTQNETLVPGQEYRLVTGSGKMEVASFDDEKVLAWRKGKLIFENASYKEVKDKLERWYGVSINEKGLPSSSWNFTGSFENQMLSTVLTTMSSIEDFTYTIKNKEVSIKF